MKSTKENIQKRAYSSPKIEHIKLDNDISLQLQSTPPPGPFEGKNSVEYFNNDPYKTNIG